MDTNFIFYYARTGSLIIEAVFLIVCLVFVSNAENLYVNVLAHAYEFRRLLSYMILMMRLYLAGSGVE